MATATRTLGSFFISIQFIDDVFASVTAVTSKNWGGGLSPSPLPLPLLRACISLIYINQLFVGLNDLACHHGFQREGRGGLNSIPQSFAF